jgi:hypothetical protein
MFRCVKWATIAIAAFCIIPFIPNVFTDRADRRDVRDNVTAATKTGISLTGRLSGFLWGEFQANHKKTPLPEEIASPSKPINVQVIVNGSRVEGGAVVQE